MEKVVYLIMSRAKDTFNIVYVSECEKTEDTGFFTKNPDFKCWIDNAGSEKSLHLAILPMFDAPSEHRKLVISKIISQYKPFCNMKNISEEKPDYVIRSKSDSESSPTPDSSKISCPCCGSEMKLERVLEKSSLYKCTECGLSDTRLNS